MTMIQAILFDFSQTLADSAEGFRIAEKQAETRIFQDLSLRSWTDYLEVYRLLRKDFHAISDFSRKALWQAVYWQYGREPNAALIADEQDNYWETIRSKTKLFPKTKEVLEQIALKYRLALITNTQGQTSGEHGFKMFPSLEKVFEVIIIAGEHGMPPKPDRTPFLKCLEILGIDPANAIFVGDDLKIDLGGAQAVGIQPVWLKHHLINRNWPVIDKPVPTITSLEHLLDLDLVNLSSDN